MPDGVTPGDAASRPCQRILKTRFVERLRLPLRRLAGATVSALSARAADTAAPASRMPQPVSLFQRPWPLAVSFTTRITDAALSLGFAARTSATAPATCGAAMEVPAR